MTEQKNREGFYWHRQEEGDKQRKHGESPGSTDGRQQHDSGLRGTGQGTQRLSIEEDTVTEQPLRSPDEDKDKMDFGGVDQNHFSLIFVEFQFTYIPRGFQLRAVRIPLVSNCAI